MPIIILNTQINAPVEVCFDTCRNIGLHVRSMRHTGEKAVAGRTEGYIGPGEWVTWQAKHFGLNFEMTVAITAFNKPYFFEDTMTNGPFKYMVHKHSFEQHVGGTIMRDEFEFLSPFGVLGRLVDRYFMKRYMTRLLTLRNQLIKDVAEKTDSDRLDQE